MTDTHGAKSTMTSLKQIGANRLNALKSTGPRTAEGKQRSRQNALRHGLTAETVITALEQADDYRTFETNIASDYQPSSAVERELVSRLASVLWRLRRSTRIETGLFEMQGELMQKGSPGGPGRNPASVPEWYDELDVAGAAAADGRSTRDHNCRDSAQRLAYCYLQVSRLQYGTFDLLSRYETALWRQGAQLFFMLQSARR
jgi:hypothetical protein